MTPDEQVSLQIGVGLVRATFLAFLGYLAVRYVRKELKR